MRSLLFVPADGGSKLDKAMASGADAVIIDLEDSITPERKDAARASAASNSSRMPQRKTQRPRLLVRINGLDTGMTDADLDAIVPGKPDAIVFPKAEGGASVVHLDAKLDRARGHRRHCRKGTIKILAQAVEIGRRAVPRRHFSRRQQAADRHDLGTGGPVRRARRRGQPRRHGTLTEPYRLARSICLYGAAAAKLPAIETVYVDFRNTEGLRRDTEAARRDGFTGRLAIHPAQVPVINDGVHADARADRKGQGRDRRLRGAARRRRGRHRRQDVRPPASGAGAGAAGEDERLITRPARPERPPAQACAATADGATVMRETGAVLDRFRRCRWAT